MKAILIILGSLGGAAFATKVALKLAIKYWPPKKFRPIGRKIGIIVSTAGRSKIGKLFWEGIETYGQLSGDEFHDGVNEGLDLDDKKRQEAKKNDSK